MGGSTSPSHGDGLFWKDVLKLKICAADLNSCLSDDKMLHEICGHFTVGDMNPDVEGDSNTWTDGLKAIRNMVLDKPMKGSRRVLEESKLNSLIEAAEKINLVSSRNFKMIDEQTEPGRLRFLKSTVVHKSSNSGSGSKSKSSGSSGKHKKGKYLGLGHMSMVFRKGVNLLDKTFDSGSTVTPDFSLEAALSGGGGGGSPSSGNIYTFFGGMFFGLMVLFVRI
jgi:hypothetical protein